MRANDNHVEVPYIELTDEELSTVSAEKIGFTELDNVTGGHLSCAAGVHLPKVLLYLR